jgi:short-subunit dehydrogenase
MLSRLPVAGKRVLLTGASSGIGLELARRLAAKGARLALVARREERLRALAGELAGDGPEPVVLVADLGRRGVAAEVAERARAGLGSVDILINNAGSGIHGLQWVAADTEEARELLEVQFWSPLALTAALVPEMLERGFGAVVNVTSTMQVSPFPAMGHSAASKAALGVSTQALRLELYRSGVHVLEAPLGMVDTANLAESKLLPGGEHWLRSAPKGKPEVAAARIISGLERRRDLVLYPRLMAPVYHVAIIGRTFARRFAKYADRRDERLLVRGSQGSAPDREARAAWEAEHGLQGETV